MIIKDVSAAELEVMVQIWNAKEPITIKDIWHNIGENKWTYQTVQTFVNRLHMKGFIEMVGKKIRSFEYIPAVTRAEYVAFTKINLFDGSEGATITELVQALYSTGKVRGEDLDALAAWINQIRG